MGPGAWILVWLGDTVIKVNDGSISSTKLQPHFGLCRYRKLSNSVRTSTHKDLESAKNDWISYWPFEKVPFLEEGSGMERRRKVRLDKAKNPWDTNSFNFFVGAEVFGATLAAGRG